MVYNSIKFNMAPWIYFTSMEMEFLFMDSLKVDPYELGVHAEVFMLLSHKGVFFCYNGVYC